MLGKVWFDQSTLTWLGLVWFEDSLFSWFPKKKEKKGLCSVLFLFGLALVFITTTYYSPKKKKKKTAVFNCSHTP